jgi:hypothetical protein
MVYFKLKAKRDLLPKFYLVQTYEEEVQVINGIAIVKTFTARDRMLHSGAYDFVCECDQYGRPIAPVVTNVPPAPTELSDSPTSSIEEL